jgi:hypothetical protein
MDCTGLTVVHGWILGGEYFSHTLEDGRMSDNLEFFGDVLGLLLVY